MRIAFDVGTVGREPTGVAVYATAMAQALSTCPDRPDLVLVGRQRDAVGLPETVPSRWRRPSPYPWWLQVHAVADAAGVDADLLHATDGTAPLRRGLPIVLTVHDLSVLAMPRTHPWYRRLRIPLVAIAPRLAAAIIAPSVATADELHGRLRVPRSRIYVIPYAPQRLLRPAPELEVRRATETHGLAAGRYLFALGTLEPRKNHLRLVAAFERLVSDRRLPDDAELVLAGRAGWQHGPLLKALANSPVARRIRRLGYVPPEDLAGLLTGARVAVYLSLYEGFGLPVVEAMACGAPTVTSSISSMPEVAGDAGFLVDPFDVQAIADGLVEAWGAEARDPTIRERAVRRAADFSWERAAAATVRVYRTVLGGG